MLGMAMFKLNMNYGIVFCILALSFRGTETQCRTENRFGPDCDFYCHCINNEQCNRTTGDCPAGCDFDWAGPACQRKNIVPVRSGETENLMFIRHSSNMPSRKIAYLAVDNDLSTCSYTNYANQSTEKPWWRLWLNQQHNIKTISIRSSQEYLVDFKEFQVMVVNNSVKYDSLRYDGQQLCYQHNNSVPQSTLIEVKCNKAIYGNELRIMLATEETQLVLCDVRIYGECEIGTYGDSCTEKCSPHCDGICDKENGTCAKCLNGWTGSYCTQTCMEHTFGDNCSQKCSSFCRNNSVCNNVDGSCLDGCHPGYTGSKCNTKCQSGNYGQNCLQNCSKHCIGGLSNCDNVYGSCLSGCLRGWIGRQCDEACPAGFWGLHCANECGKCATYSCKHTDGVCDKGCAPGYKQTPHCDEECDNGSYGTACSYSCNTNCKYFCDKRTGECIDCLSGWHGSNCTIECEGGTWGENCERRCQTCYNQSCDRFSGLCNEHCKPGFKQTKFCDQECDDGWYGVNCSQKCSSNCKEDTFCMKVDGSCLTLNSGFQGSHCETEMGFNLTEAGVAGIVVAFVVLIAISFVGGICVTRRRIQLLGKYNSSESAVVSYSNALVTESTTEVVGNDYETIKSECGIEHSYS